MDKSITKLIEESKLAEAFEGGLFLEKKAEELEDEARKVYNMVVNKVRTKLDYKVEIDNLIPGEQINEMRKQWMIMAASMINVKRSIKLTGFNNMYDLYGNRRYGIKEYKKYSSYDPFFVSIHDLQKEKEPLFTMSGGKLTASDSAEELDFLSLYGISQLKEDKITELIDLTGSVAYVIESWRAFYAKIDIDKLNEFKMMAMVRDFSDLYVTSKKEKYIKFLKNIDEWIQFNNELLFRFNCQAHSIVPIIEKWKEANKNFMVLNELMDLNLKV